MFIQIMKLKSYIEDSGMVTRKETEAMNEKKIQ
jgi:hypothetical protein